jgi:ubiquinone/menaquinone biosynthesis C-methylase UbiE
LRALDLGCGIGRQTILFEEFGIEGYGIDISSVALKEAKELSRSMGYDMDYRFKILNKIEIPFEDNYFDLVISINTLHNLPIIDCKQAFKEISRVSKKNAFVMNDAWLDEKGKQSMLKWNLTALTYMSCEDWKILFKEVGYKGDYYWFFAE